VVVWRAIAGAGTAIRFWILNLPTLLRLTWFPLALLAATSYYWTHWNSLTEIALIESRENPAAANGIFLLPLQQTLDGVLIFLTLQLIALSAAAVAVHRFIVKGERRRGEFFAFAFGPHERAYFAMGVIAYALMIALIAGQYAAQLTWPEINADTIISVAKPYAELGPWVLSMFAFPGELPIFEMPPLNYALWAALVIATFALIIRIAPWPALAATEDAPLRHTLALTHGRTLTTVVYFATVAAMAAIAIALMSLAGLSSLVAAGYQDLGAILDSIAGDGASAPRHPNIEIQSVIEGRRLAFYQEIARFIAGLVGTTLGATIISHLYLTLRNEPAA